MALRKVTGVTCIIGAVRLTALLLRFEAYAGRKRKSREIRRRAVAFPGALQLVTTRAPSRRRRTSRPDLRSVFARIPPLAAERNAKS